MYIHIFKKKYVCICIYSVFFSPFSLSMPKPSHIILIRHGESAGNLDQSLFRTTPDHKMPLTQLGYEQAVKAGLELAELLSPGERVQFYVSPYERTRQTLKGIIEGLQKKLGPEYGQWRGRNGEEERKVVVFEEPRLREQDWGNFQPDDEEMKKIREDRRRYGHFFYRIPHGESGSDVYDRLSTFTETLHRAFQLPHFPSKCVIITHGLLIRLFLTRWYHLPYEEYEAMENLRNCEFVIMELNRQVARYNLITPMRMWATVGEDNPASGENAESEKIVKVLYGDGVESFENAASSILKSSSEPWECENDNDND